MRERERERERIKALLRKSYSMAPPFTNNNYENLKILYIKGDVFLYLNIMKNNNNNHNNNENKKKIIRKYF